MYARSHTLEGAGEDECFGQGAILGEVHQSFQCVKNDALIRVPKVGEDCVTVDAHAAPQKAHPMPSSPYSSACHQLAGYKMSPACAIAIVVPNNGLAFSLPLPLKAPVLHNIDGYDTAPMLFGQLAMRAILIQISDICLPQAAGIINFYFFVLLSSGHSGRSVTTDAGLPAQRYSETRRRTWEEGAEYCEQWWTGIDSMC